MQCALNMWAYENAISWNCLKVNIIESECKRICTFHNLLFFTLYFLLLYFHFLFLWLFYGVYVWFARRACNRKRNTVNKIFRNVCDFDWREVPSLLYDLSLLHRQKRSSVGLVWFAQLDLCGNISFGCSKFAVISINISVCCGKLDWMSTIR